MGGSLVILSSLIMWPIMLAGRRSSQKCAAASSIVAVVCRKVYITIMLNCITTLHTIKLSSWNPISYICGWQRIKYAIDQVGVRNGKTKRSKKISHHSIFDNDNNPRPVPLSHQPHWGHSHSHCTLLFEAPHKTNHVNTITHNPMKCTQSKPQ